MVVCDVVKIFLFIVWIFMLVKCFVICLGVFVELFVINKYGIFVCFKFLIKMIVLGIIFVLWYIVLFKLIKYVL